jgi:leucyl-tRNA synthetase
MKKYNPSQIEKKWQAYWEANQTFAARDDSGKPKKYVLMEFPYPSGDGLHMGHVRGYTAGDVVSRYYRMNGFEVLYPIGWDAFGLPAENYAIKHGKDPKDTTASNIANIKKQFKSIGYSFDWSREINTTDPEYYKWTQWLFLQFFKAGLAYEKTGLINWCPKDKTGLANEEVINGACERCGTKVEKKELRQWYLKITEYAEKLLEGLKNLPEWPAAVKSQQENWIGKSEGAEIDFYLDFKKNSADNDNRGPNGERAHLKVFTTRPDTIFGATFLVIAPEHLWVQLATDSDHDVLENKDEVKEYLKKVESESESEIDRTISEREKTGIELKGVKAINPATKEEIPIFVADYVLGNYGTGAIMAVPGHDERDREFAEKFNLPIIELEEFDSGNKFGTPKVQYKLRDWVFSRQRYWGEPIPLVHCTNCAIDELEGSAPTEIKFYANDSFERILSGVKKIETRALNPEEPERYFGNWKVGDYIVGMQTKSNEKLLFKIKALKIWKDFEELAQDTESQLKINQNYINLTAKELYDDYNRMVEGYSDRVEQNGMIGFEFEVIRKVVPIPEDRLPVVLPEVKNYEPTGTGESPLAAIDEWVNTTCPKCGGSAKRETNTMPQWAGSSWYYLRYADPRNNQAFADQEKLKHWLPVDLYFGGMEHTTLHLLYSRFWNIFLYDKGLIPVSEPYAKRVPHGIILAADGSKMSKSKGNVVNPDAIVKEHGADTLRMYELFLGPHGAEVSWSDKGIIGVARFLDRVWYWVNNAKQVEQDSEEVQQALHKTIKKVTEDIENFQFNTVVSTLMSFHNEIKDQSVSKETMQVFAQLLYPLAPHIAEEINELVTGKSGSLQFLAWPKYNEEILKSNTVNIVVQVNGKVKDTIVMPISSSEEVVKASAMQSEKIQAQIGSKDIKRIIFVPDKIINIVV